jgi:hypothetical protein
MTERHLGEAPYLRDLLALAHTTAIDDGYPT